MYRRQLLGGTVAVIIVVQWWPNYPRRSIEPR